MLCSSLALMISISFCTLYMLLWMQAMDANKTFSIGEAYSERANYYDTCSAGEQAGEEKTDWGTVLAFNSVLYLLHSVCNIFVLLSFVFPAMCICGVFGHAWGSLAHLVAIIVTGSNRYGEMGKACALSTAPLDEHSDLTFVDHGNWIANLFIAQCVMLCFYAQCVGFSSRQSYNLF